MSGCPGLPGYRDLRCRAERPRRRSGRRCSVGTGHQLHRHGRHVWQHARLRSARRSACDRTRTRRRDPRPCSTRPPRSRGDRHEVATGSSGSTSTTGDCRAGTSSVRSRRACAGWTRIRSTSTTPTIPTRTPRWRRPSPSYDDLIRQGKIRYVGLSNHPAWQVVESLWIADDRRLVTAPVAAQVKYNLIDRAAERELASRLREVRALDRPLRAAPRRPACRPRSPRPGGRRRPALRRYRIQRRRDRRRPKGRRDSAGEWGLAPYQLSLAWLLSRPAVASVIVGAETVDELRANATVADVELEPAQLEALTALASEPAAFYHRAGEGPERPPATTGSAATD